MRFKLTLQPLSKQNIIPINYQYEISGWIYKTMHFGNPEFSAWLHNYGYVDGSKSFKLFTFSGLELPRTERDGDRLRFPGDPCTIYISFYIEEAVEPFIIGLFKNQEFGLGDRISRTDFRIASIEKQPEPTWEDTMSFRTTSPVVISQRQNPQSKSATYLSPEDIGYEELFLRNLLAKYKIICKQRGEEAAEFDPNQMVLNVTGKAFSKMIKIKAGTPEQTFIKGYLYNFSLKVSQELMKIGYYAGFGEKNSLGFGCVEAVSG